MQIATKLDGVCLIIGCFLLCDFAYGLGEIDLRFGKSSNIYEDSTNTGSQFVSPRAQINATPKGPGRSGLLWSATAEHLQFLAHPHANENRVSAEAGYTLTNDDSLSIRQAWQLSYVDKANFLRQKLSTYTLRFLNAATMKLATSDVLIMVPVKLDIFGQETVRRSERSDMFEGSYKQDNVAAGLDAAWRRYSSEDLTEGAMLGFSSIVRAFSDKPSSNRHGAARTPDTNHGSAPRSRDVLTQFSASYFYASPNWDLEPGGRLGYNQDLQSGSEDYTKLELFCRMAYRSRTLESILSGSLNQRQYRTKRASIVAPATAPRLVMKYFTGDFHTTYRLTERISTGGGFSYHQLISNHDVDSYRRTQFFAAVKTYF